MISGLPHSRCPDMGTKTVCVATQITLQPGNNPARFRQWQSLSDAGPASTSCPTEAPACLRNPDAPHRGIQIGITFGHIQFSMATQAD